MIVMLKPTKKSWTEAIKHCEDLTLGGYDWRLPNIRELISINLFTNDLKEVFNHIEYDSEKCLLVEYESWRE